VKSLDERVSQVGSNQNKNKRLRIYAILVAVGVAAGAAAYYYGWSEIRYWLANAETRQKLDTEKLDRGYRTAAKLFEEQVRTLLQTDPDIAAKKAQCNAIIVDARQKYMAIVGEIVRSANSFAAAHSVQRSISVDDLHIDAKDVFPDTQMVTEIRLDSVVEKPTSIRMDYGDLIKRYHADVSFTVAVVTGGGKSYPMQAHLSASANPQKDWSFPTAIEAKSWLVTALDGFKQAVESSLNPILNKAKLDFESILHKEEEDALRR